MSKNGSKKLTFQAPWDFDSAFGIRSGYEDSRQIYAAHAGNPWLRLFASQPWFMEMVKERWQEIKAQGIPEKTLALILTLQETYAPCFEQNSARWPSRIAQGNHELIEELNNCQSQQEAADYLYRWLSDRFSFLDAQWQ
ncbi:MAG: CotH kinase family protein [Clostridia bacterium]|nr:CotH kinase family protein [Clostridia bacterium]